MNENIFKEFYIGRTVFLEPVNFKEKHKEDQINLFSLLEIPFKIKKLKNDADHLSVMLNYQNQITENYSQLLHNNNNLPFYLTSINSSYLIISNTKHDNFITCYHQYDKKDQYKFFLDKNDNLKLYQNLHYSNLISQKQKELENLKTKLSTINN